MDQSEVQKSALTTQFNELLGRGQAYAAQIGGRAQAQLRERPFIAVAGALALGFIAGALLARRQRR